MAPDGQTTLKNGGGYPLDSYTPTEWQSFMNSDGDLGSANIIQLPTGLSSKYPHLGVMGSKDSYIRIFNLANLSGQGSPGHTGGELQRIAGPIGGLIRAQGTTWTDPATGKVWVFIPGDRGISGLQVAIDGLGNPSLQPKWTLANGWTTSAIMADGVLFAAVGGGEHTDTTATHKLQAINPTTGGVVWSAPIGQFHWASPIVANGIVYMCDGNSGGFGTGTGGSLHAWNLGVLTPDFSISATPRSQPVTPGKSVTSAVNLSAINQFNNPINLTLAGLPSGATASFSPTSLTGSGSSTLVVTTNANTPLGNYTLTLTGTSGALTHSTTVSLLVTQPSVGPAAISINYVGAGTMMDSSETAGVVPKAWWNNAATVNFHMTLLDENGFQTAVSTTWAGDHVSTQAIPDSAGNNRMMNGYINTGNTTTSTLQIFNIPPNPNGWSVFVYCSENTTTARVGAYQISGTGIPTTTIQATEMTGGFSGRFTEANNSPGNYVKFTIGNVNGFSINAKPVSSSDASLRAPINGLQIVPITTPGVVNTISINFAGAGGAGINMDASESAGVVQHSHWNNAAGLSGSNVPLTDNTGATTGAALTWNDPKSFTQTGIVNSAGDNRMMKTYLDASATTTTTVAVSGLSANSNGYKVYVYFDGNNGTELRQGAYKISGPGIATTTINGFDNAGADFSGTFIQADNSAGNYLVFTIGNVPGFNLSATALSNGATNPRAPLNGIQIVPQ